MKYFKKGKYKRTDIKAEYKRLAKIYHPDTPTGSHKAFQELNNEYHQILARFDAKAQQNGNKKESAEIKKEMKTISDLIENFIPKQYQPIAKAVTKQLGGLLINELKKRL